MNNNQTNDKDDSQESVNKKNDETQNEIFKLIDEVIEEDYFDDILLNYPHIFKSNEEDNLQSDEDVNLPSDEEVKISAIFNELIQKLSIKKEGIKDEAGEILETISPYYQSDYRHSYYSIYQTICEISQTPENLQILTMNMDIIKDEVNYSYAKTDKVNIKFKKFYDYVMLEAVRLHSQVDLISKIDKASEDLKSMDENIANQEIDINSVTNKLQEAKDGYISNLLSVLGVFSGVIIAFFGGLQYIGSAFNQINSISKYRLVFISLLTGFVVYNTITSMMVFMSRMIGKQIYDNCTTQDCSCENKCNFYTRLKNRMPYIFYINVTLVVMMIVTFLLWLVDNCTS